MQTVNNVKPKNLTALNIKPRSESVNPTLTNFAYMETRTINKGQSVIWGLNWLITYPASQIFQGVRI